MKRRMIALAMALVMCLSLVPTVAFADGHDGQVRVIVENTTYAKSAGAPWEDTLVDKWVAIDNDSTMMSCVVEALTANGYTQEGADSGYISEINGLAEHAGGAASGWMGTLNDWFANKGFDAFTVEKGTLVDGDEIRIMYTCDLGTDIGSSESNNDKTVKSVIFSDGTLDTTFASDTNAYTLTVPAGTESITVTPTASNKNYQVRTFVDETEYKRTAAIPVTDGTVITVKCGDPTWPSMNGNAGEAQTYTFTVRKSVPAESFTLNKSELTLAVGASETLTATVTPNATTPVTWSSSDEAIATVSDTGEVTAVAAGTATITATAGAKTATCAVTVEQPTGNTVTVNVAPSTVNVTFYSDVAAATELSASAVQDNGTVKVGYYNYHQYVLTVPAGDYSYRGNESGVALGGEQFTVTEDENQTLNLLRVNVRYNGASLNQEGDYNFTLKNGENEVAYGEPYVSSSIRYTPTLLIAGVAHTGTVTLNEKWEDEFYLTGNPAGSFTNMPSKTATSAATLNLPITAYKIIRVTAPAEATTTFYKQDVNYVVEPVTADSSKDNEDGTVTYLFKSIAAHSNYQFRSMMSGKVTQAGYLADGDNITVTFPTDRTPADTGSTLAYDDNSVLLNINEKNKLNLAAGKTFKLRAFRAAWEIINTTTGNQMIEPDFHFAVLSGSDVISIAPTTKCSNKTYPNAINGNATGNWMNVTAENPGTAVVAVWYDAIDVYNANPPAEKAFSTFGATDPARYGIFVVTVGEDKNLSWNPVSHDGDWDAEFDTVYYVGDSGVFTFKPTETVTGVTVQNVLGTTLGNAKPVTASADGSYAVPVTTGANIIAVTTAEGTDYQVVRARQISYTVTNKTTNESAVNAAPAIKTKDTVIISFSKLDMPLPKMSGIYNPAYMGTGKTAYVLNDTYTLTSAGAQYDFSVNNSITFKAHVAGENSLKGYISLSSMGDPFGNHRAISDEGKAMNGNASEVFGSFGVLPDIRFTVTDNGASGNYMTATRITKFSVVAGLNTFTNAFNWNQAKDTEACWNKTAAQVSTFGLIPNVTTADYNNVITFRYWYEGEEVHSLQLVSGVAGNISRADFPLDPTKLLHLQVEVKPIPETLGAPVVYNYLAFPGSGNQTYVHPFIKSLTAKVGQKPVPLPINTVDTNYTLEVGSADDKLTLSAVQLVQIYNTATTADQSDRVTLTKLCKGEAVDESITVLEMGLPNNPNRNWTVKDLDITDADALELKVTSYADKSVSRTYHIDLINLMRTNLAVGKIAAIDTVTLESKSAIDEARAAYDALSDAEKAKVTNDDVLTKAEAAYANLMADKDAVDAVIASINGIGTVTLDSKGNIDAARTAYNALKNELKEKVTNYSALTAAEATYANLMAEIYYTAVGDSLLANAETSTPTVGSKGGEWLMLGLARSGRSVPAGYYDNVVQYVKAKVNDNERLHNSKSTDNSRVILALTAIGKDPTKVGGHDLTRGLNSMSYLNKQGTNGPVWALIALDSHNYAVSGDDVTREKLIDTICRAQMDSGGWYISDDDNPMEDVDMTAMAVQALAPYYKKNNADAKSAVDKALTWLASEQGKDGDFGSSESDAQVIVALCALDIDPASNSRFIKGGSSVLSAMCSYYADGAKGFKHTKNGDYDQMATEQCYYALVAYDRFVNGETALYDMSDVHQMTKTAAKAATCTAEGNNEYYTCSACKKVFTDADGKTETTVAAETLTKLGHAMTKTDAKAPTCTADGNNEYWTCSVCKQVFKADKTTLTTVAAETLTKLGHNFTKKVVNDAHLKTSATCTTQAVYYKSCECGEKGTATFASGSTTAHNYGDDGKCTCGAENPMKDVKTGNIAPATEVGGKTVKPEEGKQIVADDSGLAVKTDSSVALNDVKDAVAAGSTVVKIDENVNKTITATEADKTGIEALKELASDTNITGEQKNELDKIVAQLVSYNTNAAKPNVKVEQVVDVSLELVKASDTNVTLGEIKELAQPVEIRIPVTSNSLKNAFANPNKVVKAIISHTEVNGDVTTIEADVTFEDGKAIILMDAFSTVAFVTYDKAPDTNGGSSSYKPADTRTFTTDLAAGSINAVFVDGKKLDSKYYTISGSTVTLTKAFMATLKAGKHTIRIENATRMATATFNVAANGVMSARTGDAGVVIYFAMGAMSYIGSAAWIRKRKDEM